MTTRHTTCSCGQLHLSIEGEPSRVSMCSCLACQRRTGAVISNQARFRREQITFSGKVTTWVRAAESGHTLTFHFCPTCGSTVYWENTGFPGTITVAIGNFADPHFPAAGHRGVGRVTPPLGVLAARHTAQARCKAGVKEAASPLVESPCPLWVICGHCGSSQHDVRFTPENGYHANSDECQVLAIADIGHYFLACSVSDAMSALTNRV